MQSSWTTCGSGTTAHSVINLNREDGGSRKFLLVEMGEYFDTVLLPRIKKITFAPRWKEGRPHGVVTKKHKERGPRIVKYVRLESYEDALNNIEVDHASGQQAIAFDDYLLKYLLQWETKSSQTFLNVERLAQPFDYRLHVQFDGQTRVRTADVPETFNYLIGLNVQRRQVHHDGDRRYLVYHGVTHQRRVTVIWRATAGWREPDLERDKCFVAERQLTDGADEVFVNGDSFISNAKALEPIFKARMFATLET